ncbi:MAG: hypothetical protein WCA17_10660 [Burkholderiales bacterium]
MNEQNDDPYEGTTQWLVDSARRRSPEEDKPQPATESSEELLQFLEERTGRSLRSRKAIERYIAESVEGVRANTKRGYRTQLILDSTLLLGLVVAILQYYYWDVFLQMDKLERITIFVPAKDLAHHAGPD